MWVKLFKKSEERHPKDPRWYNANEEEEGGEDGQRGRQGPDQEVREHDKVYEDCGWTGKASEPMTGS